MVTKTAAQWLVGWIGRHESSLHYQFLSLSADLLYIYIDYSDYFRSSSVQQFYTAIAKETCTDIYTSTEHDDTAQNAKVRIYPFLAFSGDVRGPRNISSLRA